VTICVLDASFTFQWLFEDEASPAGDAALGLVSAAGAAVPALWFIEVTNVLGMAERRGRLTQAGLQDALRLLRSLKLSVDEPASLAWSEPVLDLMRTHRLTAYDATYLELAARSGLPLATGDKALRRAAGAIGVTVLEASAA
jgi:predicted nucleic acid-binding protein